jgi:L-asparaginase
LALLFSTRAWAPLLAVTLLLPSVTHAQVPRVLVITTGGTIGLSGVGLVEGVPQLTEIADITVEEFVRFGSSSMRPAHWVGLSRCINEAFESDAALAGVIVTGAMRGPTAISADGPANVISAALVATSPEARGMGVLVVLNDWIHSARDVRKMDSNRVETFRSEWGPLGLVDSDGVLFHRALLTRHTQDSELELPADTVLPEVPVVADYAGSDGSMIRAMAERGVAGIVVQAFANGRSSPGTTQAMRDVAAQGIPIALASRVP